METRLTPREIIQELVRNMHEGLEPLVYTALAPNRFDVYLAADDFKALEPIFPDIRAEAQKMLDAELRGLNERGRPGRKAMGFWKRDAAEPVRYERKGPGWEIEFSIDHEPDAAPGTLTIHSYFALSRTSEYGVGSRTKRVVTRGGGAAAGAVDVTYDEPEAPAPAGDAPGRPFARISFTDRSGEQVYLMCKESVVAGRKDEEGRGYWADLKLDVPPDVSREHFRLRRDPSGLIFIKDLSRFGTRVDGKPLPSSMETVDGERRDRDVWVPLPDRAEIRLADIVTLYFEALPA